MSSTYEPAGREGEAERPGPAPAVTRQHRKMMAVVLAALGVAAIIAVAGSGESGVAYELLESTGNLDAAHNRGVLQQLLAEVERANSDTVGTDERPVELEQKAAKSLPEKPCNAACQQRKKEIAARMKALRDQINHDFKAMTSFGHKAGYLPPPQSIKQQVMSGSLLSQSKEPVAPPPFSPTLSAKAGSSLSGTSSSDSAAAPAAAAAPSPAEGPEDSSSGDSPSLATADPPKDPPALPVAAPDPSASLSAPTDDSSDDGSDDDSSPSDSGVSSKGSSKWAKAFAFMHHTDNPVVGDAASRADTGSDTHSSRAGKKEDPLKAAESDKFLAGFEDPDGSDSATRTKLHVSSHHSSASADDPDSPLEKGSDPLKSAESDKFLAGFLGGRRR